METSRREVIKNVGLTGLAEPVLPRVLSANDSARPSEAPFERIGLNFLFQGDLITNGNRSRDNDWSHLLGHGYACLIACFWIKEVSTKLTFIKS